MDDSVKQLYTIDRLLAGSLAQQAQIDVLLALVEALALRSGVSAIEGLPIREFFQREKLDQIERILVRFEDTDPSVAAFLQEQIDRWRTEHEPPPAND